MALAAGFVGLALAPQLGREAGQITSIGHLGMASKKALP